MSKLQSWALMAVVAVLAVFAAGWFLLLSPQKSNVKHLKASTESVLQNNNKVQGKLTVLKAKASAVPQELAEIATIKNRLPATPALAAYVRSLTSYATAAKVQLVSVAPGGPAAVTLQANPTAPAAPAPTGAPANLQAIPITITVNGDYYPLQQFLAKIESAQRASVVSTVSLAPGAPVLPKGEKNEQPGWQTIQMQISLSVFESSALSQPAPGTAPTAVSTATSVPASPAPSAPSSVK